MAAIVDRLRAANKQSSLQNAPMADLIPRSLVFGVVGLLVTLSVFGAIALMQWQSELDESLLLASTLEKPLQLVDADPGDVRVLSQPAF